MGYSPYFLNGGAYYVIGSKKGGIINELWSWRKIHFYWRNIGSLYFIGNCIICLFLCIIARLIRKNNSHCSKTIVLSSQMLMGKSTLYLVPINRINPMY